MATTNTLDQYLELDADQFTESMAKALLHFSVTNEAKKRAAEYADKSDSGTITEEEKADYLRIIELDELLSVLHARARVLLAAKS